MFIHCKNSFLKLPEAFSLSASHERPWDCSGFFIPQTWKLPSEGYDPFSDTSIYGMWKRYPDLSISKLWKKKMWLKRLHKRSPSHHHFYAWYVCLPFPWLPQNVTKSTSKKYGTSDTSLLALLNVQNQARQAMNSPKICMADLGCPKPVSKIAIFIG
jgi:hypothetical protein